MDRFINIDLFFFRVNQSTMMTSNKHYLVNFRFYLYLFHLIFNTFISILQIEEEDDDAVQDEEDANTAKDRITELIEQQVNEAKDKLEAVKVCSVNFIDKSFFVVDFSRKFFKTKPFPIRLLTHQINHVMLKIVLLKNSIVLSLYVKIYSNVCIQSNLNQHRI